MLYLIMSSKQMMILSQITILLIQIDFQVEIYGIRMVNLKKAFNKKYFPHDIRYFAADRLGAQNDVFMFSSKIFICLDLFPFI